MMGMMMMMKTQTNLAFFYFESVLVGLFLVVGHHFHCQSHCRQKMMKIVF